MDSHQTLIRVRYAETDQMGIAHHAIYYVWMEVARVELCEVLGFRYRDMERDGILMPVVETTCRYASSAKFDDTVAIDTKLAGVNSRMVRFSYHLSVNGRPVATGATRHVFLNREMKPTRLPRRYYPLFGLDLAAQPAVR
jgi:acyl-CoA thioester hydrolase